MQSLDESQKKIAPCPQFWGRIEFKVEQTWEATALGGSVDL